MGEGPPPPFVKLYNFYCGFFMGEEEGEGGRSFADKFLLAAKP